MAAVPRRSFLSNLSTGRRVTEAVHYDRRAGFSSDEDEDEEDELDMIRHEEALDQAISDRMGEAEEAPSTKHKTDEQIAADYEKEIKKKKPRPKLEVKDLIGVNGLIRIPNELKAIKYTAIKKDPKACAKYSHKLIAAYKAFCHDLFASQAPEDVLLTIEKLGSNREVKAYLNNMRNDVRNNHLEKLYGREKAEKMLQELEHGLQQQQMASFMDNFENQGISESSKQVIPTPRHQEMEIEATHPREFNEHDTALRSASDQGHSLPQRPQPDPDAEHKETPKEQVNNTENRHFEGNSSQNPAKRRRIIDESSDEEEEEADFGDISGSPTPTKDPVQSHSYAQERFTAIAEKTNEHIIGQDSTEGSTSMAVNKESVPSHNVELGNTSGGPSPSCPTSFMDETNKVDSLAHEEVLKIAGINAMRDTSLVTGMPHQEGGRTETNITSVHIGIEASEAQVPEATTENEIIVESQSVCVSKDVKSAQENEEPQGEQIWQASSTFDASQSTKDSESEVATVVPTLTTLTGTSEDGSDQDMVE